MAPTFDHPDQRLRDYRREFLELRLPGYARLGASIAFAINTAFIALDWLSFPEHFPGFLGMRVAMNLLFAAIFAFGAERFPRASTYAICLSLGASMLIMILATGGIHSHYFAGLMLLFLAMGVVFPLTGWEAAGLTGVVLVPLLGSALGTGSLDGGAIDVSVARMHVVFLLSAAAESVASCVYLERMRIKDFLQRRDIQEARDHLEEMDRAKSRFTANIHHELRTPLTLTLAPIESMLGGEFGEISTLQRQYLKTAEVNAIRLLKLINNLLDLAKLESEQLELTRRPIDAGRLVDEQVAGARPMAERKGIELFARLGAGLPREIHADPDALEKLLVNLIGNALKFTDAGGRIEVTLEAEDDGVALVVTDSGIGIPQDQLGRIFDRFAQVDGSTTRRFEGTGIGLSLCRELVDLHGGRIWAESDGPGQGTRMCAWLPVGEPQEIVEEVVLEGEDGRTLTAARSFAALEAEMDLEQKESPAYSMAEVERHVERREQDAAPAEPTVSPAVSSADSERPEIVVADDNADMRRLLSHLLGRDFSVRLARNGREALEAVRERAPELVLTDIMMPEMSGTELCRTLKGDPETSAIPVVLVTSKADRAMKIEGLELGADDYVTKPFHARELVARARSLVRVRRLQAEVEERNRRLEAANLRVESALTELKEAQVQLVQSERLAAVGELAAGVAHEANNPLNFAAVAMRTLSASVDDVQDVLGEVLQLDPAAGSGALEQLQKLHRLCDERDMEATAESLRELVGIVIEGLERTARLVGELRDFAGPAGSTQESVDLRVGILSTVHLMSYALRDAGVRVEVDEPPELPLVRADLRALNQVLLNLLKNAADAMSSGGQISIRVFERDEWVVVRVADQGHGVPEELQAAIFEPFCTTKAAGKGTGLGLSISRRILSEHGGALEVVESTDAGTTFELRLPIPAD